MGHGVRGTASNPYPDSRQRLAITMLHSPWMERGPRAAARMWGPVTSQGPTVSSLDHRMVTIASSSLGDGEGYGRQTYST